MNSPIHANEAMEVFRQHRRDWRNNRYVYPVISRRSKGLSIGINLNPDKACNFDCIYCQVDRTTPPTVRKVDLAVLHYELDHMLQSVIDQSIFSEKQFQHVAPDLRRLSDIAFSGDGEPTTCPQFADAARMAGELKNHHKMSSCKLVLITDACYLHKPDVQVALEFMDIHEGEIWAKLDAGTDDYYRLINQPNFPLEHVIQNIITTARRRPIVIQSLFMRVHGQPPSRSEVEAYCKRIQEIRSAGGKIKLVQVYGIARSPAQHFVTPLDADEIENIGHTLRSTVSVPVECYP